MDEKINLFIKEYNNALTHFDMIKKKHNLKINLNKIPLIDDSDIVAPEEVYSATQRIIIECKQAIKALNTILLTPKNVEQGDRLNSLREELYQVSKIIKKQEYIENLEIAIEEYEANHYLASALISGRVIVYIIDKIPGKGIDNKIYNLKSSGSVIDKSLKEQIIKADKKARDVVVHNIKVFPRPDMALALLGDAVTVLKVSAKILSSIT